MKLVGQQLVDSIRISIGWEASKSLDCNQISNFEGDSIPPKSKISKNLIPSSNLNSKSPNNPQLIISNTSKDPVLIPLDKSILFLGESILNTTTTETDKEVTP